MIPPCTVRMVEYLGLDVHAQSNATPEGRLRVGIDRDAIAKELAATFKLTEAQAAKITRRITGRVRLYQRVFELVPAKK